GTPAYPKPGRIDIAFAPSNPQVIYAGVSDSQFLDIYGVYRSTDGGVTWSQRSDYLDYSDCAGGGAGSASYGQAFYDQALSVDPNNPDVLFYGEVEVFKSVDGGAVWQNVSCVYSGGSSIHPDQHDFRHMPGSSSEMLIANDGGIWYTNNANVSPPTKPTIISLNETMNTMEFYNGDLTGNFATGAQPGANGGTQDNGSFVNLWTSPATLGAEQWDLRIGGDGFFAAIEPVLNQTYYQSGNRSHIYRSTSGPFGSYTDVSGNSTASSNTAANSAWLNDGRSFAMPYEIYKHDCPPTGCTHLIAGTYRVWESTNGAANSAGWYINSPQLTKSTPSSPTNSYGWNRSPNINQLSYSISLSTTAIVGTTDGSVQYGFGLGQGTANTATWVNVTNANAVLPNRSILDVTTDPITPTIGYAAVGGFDGSTPSTPGHVFQVTCTALCASAVWLNKTGNLPNLPVDSIMVNPKYRQQVFVGNDTGLYFTNDIDVVSPVWTRFTAGLPSVSIADLTVDRGFTTLAVWTRNRGLYAWPLPNAPIGFTPTPSATSTSTSTATATDTVEPSATATATGTGTATDTAEPSATATETGTGTPTSTPDPLPTNTATSTPDPLPTNTATSTPDPSATPLATDTATETPLVTSTNTAVASSTSTSTGTVVAATSTNTSVPATSTNTAVPATSTNTAAASATNTTAASATNTVAASSTVAGATSTAVATATVCTINFPDNNPGDPFYSYIRCLACRGVVTGFPDGRFHADWNITRGQISKIVSNAAGFNEDPGSQIYADVPPGSPYYAYINRLTNRGIMSGYPCPERPAGGCSPDDPAIFLPNANATRGQLAKIVSNAAGYNEAVSGQYYADVPPAGQGSQFYEWIMRLTNRGVMSGYACGGPGESCDAQNRPYFRWSAAVTRGQTAKIVANTFFPNCVP
ncbi:MAG: S-layer homology domain-containing protein, partial [Chloroflexota bacterium]|nr:S-layer homology domain-containing protein [Chloroflexota bacterium]